MILTSNYGLKKPEGADLVDVQDFNDNMGIIDKELKNGDTADNTVAFTSADSTAPTVWTNVAQMQSGEKHSSLFNKISTMFRNVRYLYKMLGTTNISAIGGGTVTGAIAAQSDALASKVNNNDPRLSNARTPTAHTHDERYYTEAEVNNLLNQRISKSGGTMSGALNFANGTWNTVGDDVSFGDANVAGCMSLRGKSGLTGIALHGQSNPSWYGRILIADDGGDMYLATNGSFYVSNGGNSARAAIYASAFNQSSSRRVKENIVNVTEKDAKKLMELRPVRYDYVGDDTPKDCTGLIAEEVAKILPDCVNGDVNCEDDDVDAIRGIGIDYSKFVPYIIKMLQIHDEEIKRLQKDE